MLVIDVSINRERLIDSIYIHRFRTDKNGNHTYRIVRPEGFESARIEHQYNDGYLPLLKKVINIITESGV